MPVRVEKRRGKRVLVIDVPYTKPDGAPARYRRDSEAATKAAAVEEERRIRDRIAKTGSPFEAQQAEGTVAKAVTTFGEVVAAYRASFMLTDLKVTTRRGYEQVIDAVLLPKFGDVSITSIDGPAASQLDLDLVQNGGEKQTKLARATRNNVQIVLRSLLSFAVKKGHLAVAPTAMPRLKKIGQAILEIPTTEQVEAILKLAAPEHRLSLAIMADAGLRPNEVRALLRRDLQLRRDGGQPVGGFLSVREGISFGEVDTPKTGTREIPLTPRLAQLLGTVEAGAREGHIAVSKRRQPWGQYGLAQAFNRLRKRAGLAGWTVYSLRHYAITSWLRAGIPIHVVQRMAGHSNLSTTQNYVHFLKADLEDAARRLATTGNSLAT